MKRTTKIVIATVLVIGIAVLGAYAMPLTAANDTWLLRGQLAITTALAIMYAGAAALFIAGLKVYKARMRHAFAMLAAGILLTAIGTAQLPVASAFGLLDTPWATSGLIILPFLLGGLVMYVGIRAFAQLVGAHSLLTRASLAITGVVVLSALSTFLPHDISRSPEIEFDVTNAILVWTGLFSLISAYIVLQVRQRIGAHYTHAMSWLLYALVGSMAVVVAALLHAQLTPADVNADAIFNDVSNIFGVVVGVLYLRAGYVFTQAEDY